MRPFFVPWKLFGLALGKAETAESVQTELIDESGCEYNIISVTIPECQNHYIIASV